MESNKIVKRLIKSRIDILKKLCEFIEKNNKFFNIKIIRDEIEFLKRVKEIAENVA